MSSVGQSLRRDSTGDPTVTLSGFFCTETVDSFPGLLVALSVALLEPSAGWPTDALAPDFAGVLRARTAVDLAGSFLADASDDLADDVRDTDLVEATGSRRAGTREAVGMVLSCSAHRGERWGGKQQRDPKGRADAGNPSLRVLPGCGVNICIHVIRTSQERKPQQASMCERRSVKDGARRRTTRALQRWPDPDGNGDAEPRAQSAHERHSWRRNRARRSATP